MYSFGDGSFLRWLTVGQHLDSIVLGICYSCQILIDSVRLCRMPPCHQNRNHIPDAHSEEVDDQHQHVSDEENH